MDALLIAIVIVVVVALAVAAFLISRLQTPKAGELLIVTGGPNGPEVHNKRVYVWPFVRRSQTIPIGVQKTEITLPGTMTSQGVQLAVDAVVAFKVDTDPQIVGNAIDRFAEDPASMVDFVHTIFAGHLRAIVGGMTAEETTIGRDELAKQVRAASTQEMANLGLRIDSVQIRDVEDGHGSNFLASWREKEQAKMASEARQAKAAADQAAVSAEMEAAARNAEAESVAQIRQAQVVAEADKAQAEAAQAGPLAEATARQQVIQAATKAAELEAALTERNLQVEIVRPAEAQRDAEIAAAEGRARSQVLNAQAAKETTTLDAEANKVQVELAAQAQAESVRLNAIADADQVKVSGLAQADATRAIGNADAEAIKARGLAEAEAIAARGAAFERNAGAIIQQQVAESLPEIVRAASEPIGRVGNLQVMDIGALQNMAGGNLAAALGTLPTIMDTIGEFMKPKNGAAKTRTTTVTIDPPAKPEA